ncbi:MAG: formate dehydrogenase subunit alpha [Spirochaetales bacterium]|nr:formate dehydrogenase subunit alpha [Spirochaetales bacterium]
MAKKKLTIRINNKAYNVDSGKTVCEVCEQLSIRIPTLCYVKNISEEAACSICMVEVKGARSLLRGCVTKVTEGMEIYTDTERVYNARKMNLELILSRHPLDCMTCDVDGDCELQDLAYEFGIKKSRFLSPGAISPDKKPNPWDSNPFINFDPAKCILCGRCINVCKNKAMVEAITFALRGPKQKVSTPFNHPLENTGCQFCAACVQSCPVGALVEKSRMGKGKKKDLTPTETICAYCGVGCHVSLFKDKANNLVMAKGAEGNKINDGRLCVKGRFGYEYVNKADRLTTPLIRENNGFRKATWEEAIRLTAEKLKSIKEKYGPDSIGVLGSSRCTNEDNYVVQKLARAVIGTNNIDNCARLCHSSTVAGLGQAFGAGAATNSLEDISDSDVIFIIGSNMAETHPVIAQMVKEHKATSDVTIIVADPRKVLMAEAADIFIQHNPGSDVALLNGIMKIILEMGLEKREFIKNHTEGFNEFKDLILKTDVEMAAKMTGVDKEVMEKAAGVIGKATNMMIYFTMGITQHSTGVDNVLSVANLALLTNNIGRRGAGVMPLRGQANVQGACDLGALPNVFPGYQKVADPGVIKKFEKAWNVRLSATPGKPVSEYASLALEGSMKGIYIMGENPLMTEADLNHVRKGYESLEFLSIQTIFMSETALMADVIFPATAAYEKDGSFTNTDRTVQLLKAARSKPEGTKDDWAIICELSNAMGYAMNYPSSSAVMDEIAALTPSYGGISHKRIEKQTLKWPCPDKKHKGTLFLYKDNIFKRASNKGLFSPITVKPPREIPDTHYPLILTTGRILYHYHSGNETRRVKVLNEFVPENYVEIHPGDAKKYKLKNNDYAKVSTRRGTITVRVKISPRPKEGVIFISFHFAEAAANKLTNNALDPVSKIPEYKACAAKISRVTGPTHVKKIL